MTFNHTICQGCVFAIRDGISQTGCEANMLETARAVGHDVHEGWNELGEFNVISDVQCVMCRPEYWKAKQGTLCMSELISKAEKEMENSFSAIVLCDAETTIDKVKLTVDSLESQVLKPLAVYVIREVDAYKVIPLEIHDYLLNKRFPYWKVQNIMDDRKDRRAAELVLHFKPKTTFFSTFRAGRNVHPRFYSNINHLIIRKWFKFAILNNPDDPIDGVVVPRVVYEYFGKNFVSLEDALKGEECQGVYNLKTVDQLFQ